MKIIIKCGVRRNCGMCQLIEISIIVCSNQNKYLSVSVSRKLKLTVPKLVLSKTRHNIDGLVQYLSNVILQEWVK